MMDEDILQELSPNDIVNLLEIMKQDLKTFYPLSQYVECMKEHRDNSIIVPRQTLYRSGGLEDGVYLFEAYFDLGETSYTLFHVFTASAELSQLEESLTKTKRIPWFTSKFVFQATLKRFGPTVRKVGRDKGVNLNGAEEDLLWLPPDQNLQLSEVPDGLDLQFLTSHHAELMNRQWKFKFNGSNKYLGIQITNNFGLGLFNKSDHKMVCSAAILNSGGIFCLNTDPASRGKGYAEVVVRSLANELRMRGKIPFAVVNRQNAPSQRVFRKIGFTDFSVVEFITPPGYYIDHEPISVDDS